jgi:hypothetical protein
MRILMLLTVLFGLLAAALAAPPKAASVPAKPLAVLKTFADWKTWTADAAWAWNGAWVGGQGDNTWRYATRGDATWKDYSVSFTLRIDAASTRKDPKSESHQWVWANYGNNANLGGYEAGVILRNTGKQCYRLMFSTIYQEVVLWSPKGGIMQVAPCKLEVGKSHAVRVFAGGPYIAVAVDGQRVLSYLDRPTPLLTGGVGLALHEGAASFSNVLVKAETVPNAMYAPHKPDFHYREWKGLRWGWDGNEPLFIISNDCKGFDVKLVPGYRPQIEMYWHWLNYGDEGFYADALQKVNVLEEGGKLRFEVIAVGKKPYEWLGSRTEVAVTYDAKQHRYVYDHVSDLIIPEGKTLRVSHPLEFTDPCVHGHVGSASPKSVTWETPHPWSVYKHVSGKLHKHPHNHAFWYSGFAKPAFHEAKGNFLARDGSGFWALVGDPVANPIMTVQGTNIKDAEFYTELCGWAYDVHMRLYPGKPGATHTMQPGTHTVKWQLTTVSGKQGDAWLKEATLLAAEDPEAKLLLYTAGIGHVEEFDKVVKWASPFDEYPLGPASLQDATVGHGDTTSLRLDGPSEATSNVGGSVYSDPVLEKTRYELSVWVKTKDVQGEGPGLRFGGQVYYPIITGTTDWQKIGYVCTPNQPLHTVNFSFINSGAGTVWFDDFQIRALAKDEQPVAPITAAPKPLAFPDALADQWAAWNSASDAKDPGRTLLDLSRHGNHARLYGPAALVDDNGKRAIEFDGNKAYASGGNSLFASPLTVSLWAKPGATLTNDWNMLMVGGAWNRAWMLFLFYKTPPYSIDFREGNKRIFTDGIVKPDVWTHIAVTDDGKMLTLYVNGAKIKEDSSTGKPWTTVEGPLTLGSWIYYDNPRSSYKGRLADVAVFTTALDAAAVKKLYTDGMK